MADSTELTGFIVMKNDEQQIAYAAVLVPGEPDGDFARGEKLLTEKEIERVAHKWMMSYRNVDIQHTLKNVASPVESYILPERRVVTVKGRQVILPKGSWVMASKVNDDDTWAGVKSGALTGYSVMGVRASSLKNDDGTAVKSIDAALKRTLIADLGEDWYAPFVSFVDEPCVPKAKFFALKSAKPDDPQMEPPVVKAGRSFSEDTFSVLRGMYDSLRGLITRAESERITLDSPVPVAEQNTITLTAEDVLYDNKDSEEDILTDLSFDDYQSVVGKADEDELLDCIGQITLEQFYAVQKGGVGSGIRGHTTDRSGRSGGDSESPQRKAVSAFNEAYQKDDRSGRGNIPTLSPKLVNQGYSETPSKAAQAQGIKRGDVVTGRGNYTGLKDGEDTYAKITGPVVGFGRYDWIAIDVDGTQYINSIPGLEMDKTPEFKAEMTRQLNEPPLRPNPVEDHYNKFTHAARGMGAKKSSEATVDEAVDTAEALTSVKEIENMTPEELKTVIETAVKSAIDPLTERLDALDQTVSAKAEKAEVSAKEEALTAEIATMKSAIETTKTDITTAKSEVVDQVTKSIENLTGKPASKAIQISDIVTPPKTPTVSDRDEFGRKIRQ